MDVQKRISGSFGAPPKLLGNRDTTVTQAAAHVSETSASLAGISEISGAARNFYNCEIYVRYRH
jgi:hypothetical protein